MALCQRMAPMGLDSRIAGRVGEKHFFSRIAAILFGGSRGFHPRTPTYFSLVGKVGKSTHRGGTLSMGSLPYEPHPRDDTKGGTNRNMSPFNRAVAEVSLTNPL